MFVDIIKVFTL